MLRAPVCATLRLTVLPTILAMSSAPYRAILDFIYKWKFFKTEERSNRLVEEIAH